MGASGVAVVGVDAVGVRCVFEVVYGGGGEGTDYYCARASFACHLFGASCFLMGSSLALLPACLRSCLALFCAAAIERVRSRPHALNGLPLSLYPPASFI